MLCSSCKCSSLIDTLRILLHPAYAAATAILQNVLQNPNAPQASDDICIVSPFLRLLESLRGEKRVCSRSEEAERMYRAYTELNVRACETVRQLEMNPSVNYFSSQDSV